MTGCLVRGIVRTDAFADGVVSGQLCLSLCGGSIKERRQTCSQPFLREQGSEKFGHYSPAGNEVGQRNKRRTKAILENQIGQPTSSNIVAYDLWRTDQCGFERSRSGSYEGCFALSEYFIRASEYNGNAVVGQKWSIVLYRQPSYNLCAIDIVRFAENESFVEASC